MTRSCRTGAVSGCCVVMLARLGPDINVRGKRPMRIGQLSEATGASPRSLRYYEEQHLLVSTRSSSGQRIYTDEAVERVALIRDLFQAGLCSSTIADILPCMTDTASQTPILRARLISERAIISDQIEAMGKTLKAMDSVLGNLPLDA
ncbi:MerR family transcriptional regulator [Glutamicibacter sp. AOP12-B1-11]|uniref:MerR family transcriptional regulator n=1 Tax=Glutamicibacter sp. AOP12-B1-11 TaxID=3457725 RepID=UPI004033B4B7